MRAGLDVRVRRVGGNAAFLKDLGKKKTVATDDRHTYVLLVLDHLDVALVCKTKEREREREQIERKIERENIEKQRSDGRG